MKTSEVSTVKRTDEDPGFDISIKTIESSVRNIECKFVTINMKTTSMNICCLDCKQVVKADRDGIVVCKNCAVMTCTDRCKVDDKVLCTIVDQDNRKCQVTQDVLEKALKVAMKSKMN